MLQLATGNLIDMAEQGLFDVIVHGCNCMNTMGSGIAKEIRERYSEAFNVDWRWDQGVYSNPAHTQERIWKLGNYTVADVGKFKIINAYTQFDFNKQGEEFIDRFEYESFNLILRKLAAIYPDKRFGFPYIGMGLAGGDKDRIIAMLEDFAEKVAAKGGSVTLVEFG